MNAADLAALERGCCSQKQAVESGCRLCVPRYAAIDRVRANASKLGRAWPYDRVMRVLENG